MSTLIFQLSEVKVPEPEIPNHFNLHWWRPELSQFIPTGKRKKYLAYWLFHYFKVFRNRDYSALFVKKGDLIVGSMLIVPAHFKWPFMKKQDLQFTYVKTSPEFRGQGIASLMLEACLQKFRNKERTFWYVTNKENIASQRLCEKAGFKLAGLGITNKGLKIISLKENKDKASD